jgi:hypothetical protein
LIDGNDKHYGTPGPQSAVPGIATRNDPNSNETRNSLAAGQKDNVKGLGYTEPPPNPSITTTSSAPSPSQIDQYVADLLALPHDEYAGINVSGSATLGTPAAPKITHFPQGSVSLSGNVKGAGILIVEGGLKVLGNFEFEGLIIVRGDTNVTTLTGSATIHGSIWTSNFDVTAGGNAHLQYSSQSLAFADQSGAPVGGAMPKPVVITSWRDTF